MKKIVVFGECMLEFAPVDASQYMKGIAGDVYNTSVYLKRLSDDLADVSMLTAIGEDRISKDMLKQFEAESINTNQVYYHPNKTLGCYMIDIDDKGERSFTYWRSNAAARDTFSLLSEQQRESLIQGTDIFYFSGISLAIINDNDRDHFWRFVEQLSNAGKQVVFDTNFRPRLWQDPEFAKQEFERALTFSNLVFAGVEDLELLAMGECFATVSARLANFDIEELVIKHGEHGVQVQLAEQTEFIAITPVKEVIDTTSAGDSFNAGYIYARLLDQPQKQAVELASALAAEVIQHRGAIIAKEQFTTVKNKLTLM